MTSKNVHKTAGEEIKAKIGEDATVSVIENFDKQLICISAITGVVVQKFFIKK